MQNDLLTAAEVADALRVSRAAVYKWAQQGKLAAVRVDGVRSVRFRRTDLDRLIEAGAA